MFNWYYFGVTIFFYFVLYIIFFHITFLASKLFHVHAHFQKHRCCTGSGSMTCASLSATNIIYILNLLLLIDNSCLEHIGILTVAMKTQTTVM